MEAEKRETIIKLLPELLNVTDCKVTMIAELDSRGILSSSDKEALKSKNINDEERVDKMYKILMNRCNGYEMQVACPKQTNQIGALKILKSLKERAKEKIFFNVRDPTKLFTGRVKQLEELKATFTKGGQSTVKSQNSSITGLGGIGKTELALTFIHSIDFSVDDPLFNTIIWINADTMASLNQDFKTLAKDKLGISTMNADNGELEISTILDKIYLELADQKTLIVFDDAENPHLINKYMPRGIIGNKNVSVLITSQTSNWDTDHSIRLSGMEEADAIEFVKTGLGYPLTSLDADLEIKIRKLVSRLQLFPLPIRQAIAFIKDRHRTNKHYGPEDYIKDLNSNSRSLFTKAVTRGWTSYEKTIYETVSLTLEKIHSYPCIGYVATRLLKLMAYMDPVNITDKMFAQLYDEFTLEEALLLLENFDVINFHPRQNNEPLQMNIHPLVQEILRLILETKEEEEDILLENLRLSGSFLNPDTVDHALSIWKFASKHFDLVNQFSIHHFNIAVYLMDSGRLTDAWSYVSGELERLEGKFSNANREPLIIKLQLIIGIVMYRQSRLIECRAHVSQILNNPALSKSDPFRLQCRYLNANILLEFGNCLESLQIYEEIYQERIKNANGKETAASVQVLIFIVQLYRRTNKFEAAIDTCENIIQAAEEKESLISCRQVALAKCLLALARGDLGSREIALEEYKEAHIYAEKHLHPTDVILLDVRRNLAVCLKYAGQPKEALKVHENVLENCIKFYGENHELSLNAKKDVIQSKIELSGFEDELLSQAVEVRNGFKCIYGGNHYDTLSAYALVGQISAGLGRAEEGLRILSECFKLALSNKRFSPCELEYIKYYLAICLEKLGKLSEALKIQENIKVTICHLQKSSESETCKKLMSNVIEAVKGLKVRLELPELFTMIASFNLKDQGLVGFEFAIGLLIPVLALVLIFFAFFFMALYTVNIVYWNIFYIWRNSITAWFGTAMLKTIKGVRTN